jgi:predicted transcriptional regulator
MSNQFGQLRVQAIELRRSGKSRREIKEILKITSNHVLNEVLRGEPPPDWTRRPKAKDDLRAMARELRRQGLVYNEIAAKLGVSKSSVSLWVRNIPRAETLSYEESRARQAAGVSAYWDSERERREQARVTVSQAAAKQIGPLSDREILIAGAVAYWCEGAKNKPYRRSDRIDFINSDAQLVKFFLRFLETAGVSRDRLIYRVSIHETGRPGCRPAVLAKSSRLRRRRLQVTTHQASQATDGSKEHRRGLPRLPAHTGPPQRPFVPPDRGMGISSNEELRHLK